MKTRQTGACIAAVVLTALLHPAGAAAQVPPADGEPLTEAPPEETPVDSASPGAEAAETATAEATAAETTDKPKTQREQALTSFVQLLGDAKAQTTTSGQTAAAFGGGILYRSEDQSLLILARTDASTEALDSQGERGALMLTPEANGQPSFELDWRVFFLCMTRPFKWIEGTCADAKRAEMARQRASEPPASESPLFFPDPDKLDFGVRLYLSGGTSDWTIPADEPMEAAITRRAGVLAYGVDLALRRELIKADDNYVALEAGLGGTVRNLIGDLTAGENSDELDGFLGTDRRIYFGPELYLGLTINALQVGVSLPVFLQGEIDGFSGGQLLVTAIVRDGPKLVIPD
jgi:hypothetical protein